MAKRIHVPRIREQNLLFAKGHKLHPKLLKGYKNIEPASFFTRNEKKWATNDSKRKKLETELVKLDKDDKKIATAAQNKVVNSRAAARITLKKQPKVLKDFVG
jgi:hypothetical protein